MKFIDFGDIVEENGMTIRENNLEKTHKYKVGQLVEVKRDEWHGEGACEKIHARLWIVDCGRDCDGTPLYWLSKTPRSKWCPEIQLSFEFEDGVWRLCQENAQRMFYGVVGGFSEESLTVVEITEEVRKGYGALAWEDDEETRP